MGVSIFLCLFLVAFEMGYKYLDFPLPVSLPPVQVLKAERPDVDAKRSDLLKLQGQLSPLHDWEPRSIPCCNETGIYQSYSFFPLWFFSAGEFHLRLRHLEQSLLQALNEVKGRILDDDR